MDLPEGLRGGEKEVDLTESSEKDNDSDAKKSTPSSPAPAPTPLGEKEILARIRRQAGLRNRKVSSTAVPQEQQSSSERAPEARIAPAKEGGGKPAAQRDTGALPQPGQKNEMARPLD